MIRLFSRSGLALGAATALWFVTGCGSAADLESDGFLSGGPDSGSPGTAVLGEVIEADDDADSNSGGSGASNDVGSADAGSGDGTTAGDSGDPAGADGADGSGVSGGDGSGAGGGDSTSSNDDSGGGTDDSGDSGGGSNPDAFVPTGGIFLNITVNGNTRDVRDDIAADDRIAGVQRSLNWAEIETAKGVYDWTVVDDLLAYYDAVGKRVAFKFGAVGGTEDDDAGTVAVTPSWLFDDTAVDFIGDFTSPDGYIPKLPLYWDADYQRHLGDFLAAFGDRYDGDPRLAYIRMGGWQYGTNEPNFYGTDVVHLETQIEAAGMPLTFNGSGKLILYADSLYAGAVNDMIDLWRGAFPQTQLLATIRFPDATDRFEQSMNDHCLASGIGVVNTGLNEGDKSDTRETFRTWRDTYGVKVGWGGVSNLGTKDATLDEDELRDVMVRQGIGIADDATYGPYARTAYLVFGTDILDFPSALDWAAANIEP